jgi:transposase InsO family protein
MSAEAANKLTVHPVEIPADHFVALDAVLAWFGAVELKSTQRQGQRWAAQLARRGQAEKRDGQWFVHVDAHLADGLTTLGYLKTGGRPELYAGQRLPPGSESWSPEDWARYDNTLELRRRYEEMRPRFASLNKDAFARVFEQEHGQWAKKQGLSCKRKQLDRYFRRIDPADPAFDGNVDRRGRPAGGAPAGPADGCSPEAWDLFKLHYPDPRRRSASLCYEIVAFEAERNGWQWPHLRTIQRRVTAELPAFMADYHRLGERRWRAKHGPKIERDLSEVRPNQVWVGDHAQFDFLVRLEGGQIGRPWLTLWLDQRSRRIVGWVITSQPDSDTILGAFHDAVIEHGAPERIVVDNGKDYRAKGFSGGRRGKPRLDEERIKSVSGRLGIAVTFCEPLNPGSKSVEAFFATLHERFDKTWQTYCGGTPNNRPEMLFRNLRAKKIAEPTIGAVREQFARWLDAYHRRGHSGDGMDGLCPLDVFERCDPIPRRTAPRDTLALLLQKTVSVKVTRRGVRWMNCYYGQDNEELWKRQGSDVLLRVDPQRADCVEVLDRSSKHITFARNARLTGKTQDDIKEAKKRQKRAKKLAQSALPAVRDARKTVEEHAIAAQREYAERLRQAAGGESDAPPPRGIQLLPGAADIVPVAPPAATDDSGDHALEFDTLKLGDHDRAASRSPGADYEDIELHLDGAGAGRFDYDGGPDDVSLSESDASAGDDGAGSPQGSDEPVADLLTGLNDD